MLRIQRAVLVELFVLFWLIAGGITGAVFIGATLRFVKDGGGALGGELMVDLMPSLLPVAFAFAMPFAWLAAVALGIGRWVADQECTAIQACGVHLRTIVLPVAALSALLALFSMAFNSYVVPAIHRDVRANLKDFVPRFLSSLHSAERSVVLQNGRLSFDRYDPVEQAFIGVELDRRRPDGRLEQKAIMKRFHLEQMRESTAGLGLVLHLEEAWVLTERDGDTEVEGWQRGVPFTMGRVERVGLSTLFNEFFGTSRWLYKPKDMLLPELCYVIERGGVARGSAQEAEISLHGRLVLGAGTFFLGLFALGVALVLPPSGRRVRDFMLCFVPAVLVFFPLNLAGPSMARGLELPVWLVMWSPNIALGLAAGVLIALAYRR